MTTTTPTLEAMVTYPQYKVKFLPRNLQQVKSKPPIRNADMDLPLNTCIHYISDSCGNYGIRRSHPLLQNTTVPIKVNHVLELYPLRGKPKRRNFNSNAMIQRYLKARPGNFSRVRRVERTLKETRSVLVMDYSLLMHSHRYVGKYCYWDEFYNLSNTMWLGIQSIGTQKENFINYRIPEYLPPYAKFKAIRGDIPVGLLPKWHDVDALGLKYVWDLLADGSIVTRDVAEHVTLVFTESLYSYRVNLGLLYDLVASDGAEKVQRALYSAWVNIYQTRTGVSEEALEGTTSAKVPPNVKDTIGAANLNDSITELVEAGRLSTAEQKRIWRLSESYKTIKNPLGAGTLADLATVDTAKLTLDPAIPTLRDSPGIIDKTMLRSTVNNLTERYVTDVLESDVAASVLAMQNAGLVVTGYQAVRKQDALNDYTEYSVSITPINGSPSTIHFNLPKVGTNGEFLVQGVKYSYDAQRCD